MKKTLFLSLLLLVAAFHLFSSTIFTAQGPEGVLVGVNEGWKNNPYSKIWVEPAKGSRYGVIYFGYADLESRGAINEQGLVYNRLSTPYYRVRNSVDKPLFKGDLVEKAMAECATVDDVIALFERYNLEWMDRQQLMFIDSSGSSIIVEGDKIVESEEEFQIGTNFYQSKYLELDYLPCYRYKTAAKMIEGEEITFKNFTRILKATNERSLYSVIYNITKGEIYLYNYHNFKNFKTLRLEDELAKGAYVKDLITLFPGDPRAEQFVKRYNADKPRIAQIDHQEFDSYIGDYRFDNGVKLSIIKKDNKMFALYKGGKVSYQMLPNSQSSFFFKELDEQIEFERAEGKVVAVTWTDSYSRQWRVEKGGLEVLSRGGFSSFHILLTVVILLVLGLAVFSITRAVSNRR